MEQIIHQAKQVRSDAHRQIALLYLTVLLSATGYGISFPLLAIQLEGMGWSGTNIGIVSAMPAFAWLLSAVWLPPLQRRFGFKNLLLTSLAIATVTIWLFPVFQNFWHLVVLRFLFGGSMGVFYRLIEFYINDVSDDINRGRRIGYYNTLFMLGIIFGSLAQPSLGHSSITPFMSISVLVAGSAVVAIFIANSRKQIEQEKISFHWRIWHVVPMAMFAALAYGLFEAIPSSFMSIYALRNNLSYEVSSLTLTAAAVGNLIFPIPLGLLSDRMGRTPVLTGSAAALVFLSLLLPLSAAQPVMFLMAIAVWAGLAGCLYNIGLSIIGDRWRDGELIQANATFGAFYASGSLIGPVMSGFSLDYYHSQGLVVYSTLIFLTLFGIGIMVKQRPDGLARNG